MSIIREKIYEDLKATMLSRDTETNGILKVILGELDRDSRFLDDTKILILLKKMLVRAEETKQYGGEMEQQAIKEIVVISKFLPKQLTESEMDDILVDILGNHPDLAVKLATGDKSAIGGLMKHVNFKFAGRGDNKYASARLPNLVHVLDAGPNV